MGGHRRRRGTVETSPGFLIVTQHYHAQFVIEAFLKTLEQSLEGSVAGQSIPIHRSGYPIEDDNAIFAALSRRQVLEIDHSDLNSVLEMITGEAGIRIRLDRPATANGDFGRSGSEYHAQRSATGNRTEQDPRPTSPCLFRRGGVVVISTKDVAVNHLTLRLHDISNIPPALLVDSEKDWGNPHPLHDGALVRDFRRGWFRRPPLVKTSSGVTDARRANRDRTHGAKPQRRGPESTE